MSDFSLQDFSDRLSGDLVNLLGSEGLNEVVAGRIEGAHTRGGLIKTVAKKSQAQDHRGKDDERSKEQASVVGGPAQQRVRDHHAQRCKPSQDSQERKAPPRGGLVRRGGNTGRSHRGVEGSHPQQDEERHANHDAKSATPGLAISQDKRALEDIANH